MPTTSSAAPTSPASPRVAPTLRRGIAVAVLYMAVFMVGALLSGVDYDKLSQSSSNVVGFVIIPVALAIAATLALTARWGWWHRLFHEEDTLTWPRWRWAVPALFCLAILTTLVVAPWGDWNAGLVALILIGTLLVGFGEEIVFRGYLLVAARARHTEVGAWFLTSALFGLFHGLNIVLGQGVRLTVQQIILAFVLGSGLYLIRRISGLLVVGMVIHGFWDFSTFIGAGRGADTGGIPKTVIAAPFTYGAMIVTIVILWGLFRRGKGAPAAVAPATG